LLKRFKLEEKTKHAEERCDTDISSLDGTRGHQKESKREKKKVFVHENNARWVVGFEVGSDQTSRRSGSGT
jgi:hypothetical protein